MYRRSASVFDVRVPLAGLLLILLGPCAFSATISISNQSVNPGQTVAVPLMLAAGGQAIAGIQFDLQWDQRLTVQVASGVTLGQSFKVLYAAAPAPGSLRCLIVGNNLASLTDGTMVELFVSASSGADPGTAAVTLTNIIASNGTGDAVSVQATSASIQIESGATQALPVESVLNAASLLPGALSPGEIITLLGSFPLAPSILFNGVRAPVLYAGVGQINAIVPFGLDLSGPVDLQIRSQNQTSAKGSIPVAAIAPAIFTQTGTGTGPGAVLNGDYSLNSFSNPAASGSVLMVYGTGFGLLQSPLSDGQAASSAVPLTLPVTATIGGVSAEVLYAGAAPTLIAGLIQINVRVPDGLPSNPFTPIALALGSDTTPIGVTVSIR